MIPSELPTLARLQACLNTDFTVADGPADSASAVLVLTLVEVTALDPAAPVERRLTLLLRGPAQPWLPRAVHMLEHPELGPWAMLLAPLKRNPDYAYYQGSFD